jgi:hypothetical protein
VDERTPPCGGSLGEAARRDIAECHRTAKGQPLADTDGAAYERAGRRGRNVVTRLEDGGWDISVSFTGLPSRAEHNPVRTEAGP